MENFLVVILWILLTILLQILAQDILFPRQSLGRFSGMVCLVISALIVLEIDSYKSNILLIVSIFICISVGIINYINNKK